MRLLGSNLLPFSVAQLPGTWSTGIDIEAYYFEGSIPADLSQYFLDHRKLIADCVAASRIVLRPTEDGLLLLQPYSNGIKAIAGSVYDPKLGVTVHYPTNIIPRRTTASASALDVDAAYTTNLLTGNKKMKQHLSLGMYPGFPLSAASQLMDFAGTMSGQLVNVADLIFDSLKTFDAALSDTPAKTVATTATIQTLSATSGATASGTSATLTVPINVSTNASPSSIISDNIRVTGTANARRLLPVSIGDKGTAKVTKNIGYAILLIADTNSGALAAGNYDIRFMAVEVGALNSGTLIELESTALSTGEFPEVVQVRTASALLADSGVPDWVSPDAAIAFDGDIFRNPSPTTDITGTTFTYTGWPVQSDGSIQGTKGSVAEFPATVDLDFAQSFYMEFDYRQSPVTSNAELDLLVVQTSYNDRFILALDQSNEKGLCLWNNQQSTKISRPFSNYVKLLSETFVHFLYQYDADTSTHTIKIDGVVVDTFSYKVLGYTKKPIQITGVYGNAGLPTGFLKNIQVVQGKKSEPLNVAGVFEILNNETGETFNAYVDNVNAGGGWLLISNWTSLDAPARTFSQLMQKGSNVVPLDSAQDSNFPVCPVTFLNANDQWMFTSENPGWKDLYGDYLYADCFPASKVSIAAGEAIPMVSPLGNKSLYGGDSGWGSATNMSTSFRLWTAPDNSGPCGGANRVGPNKICPCIASDWSSRQSHCDATYAKRIYIKINPAKMKLLRAI